jgi:hypothetical protein
MVCTSGKAKGMNVAMKKLNCHCCNKRIDNNEIALNLKLLGKQIGIFRCYQCLSEYLSCEEKKLEEMAEYYKNSGCIVFQTNYTD